MNLAEHPAKTLVLRPAGIAVPEGEICTTPEAAAGAAGRLGTVMVKAQIPAGKRGKGGGIRLAANPAEAARAARAILGSEVSGHRVSAVLVEQAAAIAAEYYAAVLHDAASATSLVLFSGEGGMEIEEIAATRPAALSRHHVAGGEEFTREEARAMLADQNLGAEREEVAALLVSLFRRYRETDAELIEINPLARLADGSLLALDCKFILDDAAAYRQPELSARAAPEPRTALEARGAAAGLKYIELPGDVAILANGAGLTMTTMDAVHHFGGSAANFLEIGGEAYTKSEAALALVLANPNARSVVVNFCGAFARTDVMAEGVVRAWQSLNPDLPVFFSVHGTGEAEAVALIERELGLTPFDFMEDAVKAAIAAAGARR